MKNTDRGPAPPDNDLVRHHAEPVLRADAARTVLRPFMPGDVEGFVQQEGRRSDQVVSHVLALDPAALTDQLDQMLDPLCDRHRDVEQMLLRQFDEIDADETLKGKANDDQRLLIGAYFTQEYSFASAALFNPSIVAHFDQNGVPEGGTRFILSLRGVGEGHLSSLAFRTGIWRADGSVAVDDAGKFAVGPKIDWEKLPNGRMIAHLSCGGAHDLSENVIYPFLAS